MSTKATNYPLIAAINAANKRAELTEAKARMFDELVDALREIRITAVDADLRASFHRTALELISQKAASVLARAAELTK
jgi:hypothetical protein